MTSTDLEKTPTTGHQLAAKFYELSPAEQTLFFVSLATKGGAAGTLKKLLEAARSKAS
jgi:hypothetical protein